ncbi:C4-dicarboxylate TRAP transporter substrate-binding protein [Azospirillum sp. CT11-132]|uniref:C4-dicarboxylate TRAP transporter substrate-binding protein n=1 Tax=unclassified Azospirillum TaxID=2630922 RepID=UPI000D6067FA|nr:MULTISPECIES: C4-dicarboxylate TRAP transporter substrate-binding protein [unclassified Azospirillum]PWC56699.1 C4-dicarboxylate ABC transporter [Azospirillum sp. TSH7]PWC58803.1 C4-dicarboxylate ABC transporter [Azospirillum sp. TSH20]
MSVMANAVRTALFGAVVSLVSFGASAADYTLSVNTALSQQDPLYKGLEEFKANVEKRSAGKMAVRLFPASQLGKDEDLLEQARAGAPVAVVVDGGRLAVFVKEFGVLGAPYVAQGYGGIRKVVTSPMFEEWVQKLRKASGHQVLSFNWWQGERHMLTNKPVKVPADLNGVRVRTPGAPVWMETIRAMGATPTPLPWSEVYTAMQQQVIDGAEAQDPAIYGARLYEVAKYLTKTGHINLITGIVTSAAWFDSLPKDMQTILREESLKAGDEASKATEASLADFEKQMTEKGMQVVAIDVAPFREATAPVYEKLGYGELHKQVDALLKQ